MPIYMELEGIKGTVKPSRHIGGANFAMADGSVKNIGRTGNGGGPRVIVFDANSHNHGISEGGILVSRIALPNTSAGAIDALAPNAVVKAKALFEAQRSMVTTLGIVFTIPTNGANKLQNANNLRQISLAAHGHILNLRFFITDGGNQTGVAVELENVLITNYSISGHGGDTHAGELFKPSLFGEGKKVKIDFCKSN